MWDRRERDLRRVKLTLGSGGTPHASSGVFLRKIEAWSRSFSARQRAFATTCTKRGNHNNTYRLLLRMNVSIVRSAMLGPSCGEQGRCIRR